MTIADTATPVLVLDSSYHGGLGITRSLGRLGIPVYNLDPNPWTPAFSSRYCRGKFVWDVTTVPAEESVRYLAEIAPTLGRRPILIPTTDSAAIFVAEHAASLKEWYCFPEQSPAVVSSVCSKQELYRLARNFHVSMPKTACPQTGADLLRCAESMELPLMIKATEGRLVRRDSSTKLIVRTRRQLADLYARISEAAVRNIIVQEYVPGGENAVWMFNGYFDERSNCLVGFTGAKLRQWPIYAGTTSLGVCRKNEIVEEVATTFMQALGYHGSLDMDLRYDARDGQYKVLDVNPRIGSTFRLFVSEDGMDVARALYLHLTGQPVQAGPAAEGRKWIVEDCDLAASFGYRCDGKLKFSEWLRSFRGVRETAFFAADDPLPVLPMIRADIGALRRRLKPRQAELPFELAQSDDAADSISDEETLASSSHNTAA